MIQEGSVFFLKGTEPSPHYHILLFRDPSGQDKTSIAVYITSRTTMPDQTCEFNEGDEFFIEMYSWVKYRNCKLLFDIDLSHFKPLGVVSTETLEKIKTGFRTALKDGKIIGDVKSTFLRWEDNRLYNSMH
jgi:hypothetical protein